MKNINEEAIVTAYLHKPTSIKKIANDFGLCDVTISRILKRNGCRIYKKQEIYNQDFKHNYFENIETEKQAYFLGWLISDGCVHAPKDGRQSSISLSIDGTDKYILEELKTELGCSTSVYKNRTCYTLAFRSDKMANDLMKYGVVPNKSLITYLPKINTKLYSHLLRGLLDGDGCIRSEINKQNKHVHYINFSGSHKIIVDIKDFFCNILKVNERKIYSYSTYSMITWSAISDVNTIGNYLYNNATICLKRKYDKFIDFQKHYNLI